MKDRLVSIALFVFFPPMVYLFHRYGSAGLFLGTSTTLLKQVATELALPALFLVVVDWLPAVILSSGVLMFVAALCFKEKPQVEGNK